MSDRHVETCPLSRVCVFQPVEAAYLYDAVWVYARAADALVAQGYDSSDGRRILDNIKGTTYKSTYSASGT